MFKRFITNNWAMTILAATFFLLGICLSLYFCNFQWLSRFGALIICIGILVLARPSIFGKDILSHIVTAETGLSFLDNKHYEQLGVPIPDYVIEDKKSRVAVGWLGPMLCIIGTVTNGFADFLNGVFCKNICM